MSTVNPMEQELRAARLELADAERGLMENTEAARTRYARAVHEAELAERRAASVALQRSLNEAWRQATV